MIRVVSPRVGNNNRRRVNGSPSPTGLKRSGSSGSLTSPKFTGISSPSPRGKKSQLLPPTAESSFAMAYKIALGKATECGREISAVCGNHKVALTEMSSPDKTAMQKGVNMIRKILPSLGGMRAVVTAAATTANSAVAPTIRQVEEADDNVAYLNVHSGVSMGLMAGIDIGAND
eukprot:gene44546-55425_t